MIIECKHDAVHIQGKIIKLDGYTIQKVIGKGANGIVLSAIEHNLNRPVAIKVWHINEHDSRDKVQQGKNEATKIASIPHVNIATIFNSGINDNTFYLVMELLPGKPLRDILSNKLPSLSYRINLWKQISSALRHSYSNSVFHGDLHDRNVMVVDNVVKLIDFGTSYFHGGTEFTTTKESAYLVKLARKLFPEIEDKLRKHDKTILQNPIVALFFCDSWLQLNSFLEALSIYTQQEVGRDNHVLPTLFQIALFIAYCPYIDLDEVMTILKKMNINQYQFARFIDQINTYSILITVPENKGVIDYKYNPSTTNETRVRNLESVRLEVKFLIDVVLEEGAKEIDILLFSDKSL